MKKNMLLSLGLGLILALAMPPTVLAQATYPRVGIDLATTGLTSPLTTTSTGAVIARMIFDTTGSSEPIRISSLPFTLTVGGGGSASTLNNCQVYNEANNNVSLNTGTAGLLAGANTITLSNPLVLQPNTVTTLSLRCDVASTLTANSTFTVSMNTANVQAFGTTTGQQAVVTVRGATGTPTTPPPVTPGFPNTGAGGEAGANLAIILAAGILGAFGLAYARSQKSRI